MFDFFAFRQYSSHIIIADSALNHPLDGVNPVDEPPTNVSHGRLA
ncbi:MAG: hypothetical protein ACREQD_03595 [Candidatus Binataceae bacterium]